jgi:hypothetical protein
VARLNSHNAPKTIACDLGKDAADDEGIGAQCKRAQRKHQHRTAGAAAGQRVVETVRQSHPVTLLVHLVFESEAILLASH